MITAGELYTVVSAIVPLYVAMMVAYGSVRWWKIFSADQCAGINRFVAVFAVPLLSFHFISSNDPYQMDVPFLIADSLCKLVILLILLAWASLSSSGSLDWVITLFSLATLPNTLVMGIPLLGAMYGPFYSRIMVQLLVLQCVAWYTLLLFLFEYRAARLLLQPLPPPSASPHSDFDIANEHPQTLRISDPNIASHLLPNNDDDDDDDDNKAKELRVFPWSSSDSSPLSERNLHPNEPSDLQMHIFPSSHHHAPNPDVSEKMPEQVPFSENSFSIGSKSAFFRDTIVSSPIETPLQAIPKAAAVIDPPKGLDCEKSTRQPPMAAMLKLILQMVGQKLLHNPNTYASIIGLIWALIAFRWNIEMPKIVSDSIKLLSDAGLGMAMFSLGLFMALQPRLIACGTSLAVLAMMVKFLTGPAVMASTSIAVGLRRVDLHAAIVQAALPQGIVPFVFAREYNLHPDILSTAVIFGMLISLPITLLYYVVLGI